MAKNVFVDLGFSKAEAAALQARVTLAVEIERYIEKNGFTQAKAATAFGVPQPTISKIVRGDLSRLSNICSRCWRGSGLPCSWWREHEGPSSGQLRPNR